MNRRVLIVDDNALERALLSGFLGREYDVLSATNGEEALKLLAQSGGGISAVLLDIMMPVMDGYEVLMRMRSDAALADIPVLVTTSLEDEDSRRKAIASGANDFITKPFDHELLLHRLHNAIRLREAAAVADTVWRDRLTGLLNREAFFFEAERQIKRYDPGYYVLSCLDIENFKVVNDQYGTEKGDAVLRFLADRLGAFVEGIHGLTCRFTADRFGVLFPAALKGTRAIAESHAELTAPPCIDREIRIRVGRYTVDDPTLPVSAMFDRAALANASVKGRYDAYVAEYDSSMLDVLIAEQRIVSDMAGALKAGQFVPWFQPQYNHATGALVGSEALVRWIRGGKPVPPNEFLPIFERNGFVYQMDQSMWRQVCALQRRWLDEGLSPLPVSVNVSRYDILQKDFVRDICALVEEFNLPADLLRLEITESAFSKSPVALIRVVKELIDYGFTVEIDDFGSGYSSLNTLKDVPASILKLDMRFLEDTEESERGGSILESVVRMAKWLGMSVIAEGVEEKAQADYLQSIGCHYMQGYYYAKPMPADAYAALLLRQSKEPTLARLETLETLNSNEFWNPKSMETLIFNSYVGGAAIIEYHDGVIEPLRTNERFTQEFSGAQKDGTPLYEVAPENCMDAENLRLMYENIERAISTRRESTCEIRIAGLDGDGPELYLRCTVRVIAWTNDRFLLYCVIQNISAQRIAEQRERGMSAELLDNLPCGAGLFEYVGGDLVAVHLNRQYWELVGRAPRQYKDMHVLDTIHPDDRSVILPEITDALSQHRDAVCDVRVACEEGDYRRFHIVGRTKRKDGATFSLYAFFMPASDDSLLLAEQNKSKREKGRLDFIFKNAAISVWSYNLRTGEIIQNERSRQMHGFDAVVPNVPESLIASGYVHPDSAEEYRAMYQHLRDGAAEAEGVFRVRNASRTGYWFEHIRYAAILGGSRASELFFGISSDVSAEYEQDNAIRQWMALLSEMQVENNDICEFNLTQDAFVRRQGNLFPAFQFTKSEGFDAYIRAWARQCVDADDVDRVLEFLNREKLLAMHARGVLDGGIDYRARIAGAVNWCSLSIKFVEYPAADDDVRLIMVHTDINARKEDELRLIEENRHDPLTGVLNRKAFEARVNEITEKDSAATHALFMIDLDNFKHINDSFGHVAGDHVLQKTAAGLHSLLRGDDLVGRIGGDEFMVFLKNIPNRDVIARRAQMILDMMHTVFDADVQLSGSLGVAIAPKDGTCFDALYRCADKAAYYSKQHGKNRATFYQAELGVDSAYDETTSQIEFGSEAVLKAWDDRTKQVMEENQRLIERQEEDERYRMVIESTHIVTFEWNALTGKFAASPEFDQYVLSEQGGERFFSENVDVSGIHPDDRALFYGKFLEKVLSGESAQETSLRLALKKGGYRWCRLGALVYFDKAEQLQKAIGIITEENVNKKQSDVQLDAIFKFMSAGVLLLEIKKPDITALYISESYFRLEHTGDVTLSDGDALRAVHPDDRAHLASNLFICAISGAVMEETFRVVHDGAVFWRHMHAVRIPYPDAANPVMIAVETDITDIKQRQEQLEKQQGLFGSVFDELHIISWYFYPAEHRAVLNNACAQSLALDAGEIGNAPDRFVSDGTVHPDDAAAFEALHRALENGAETASAVIRVRRPGQGYEARKLVYISLMDKNGQSCCAIGVSEPLD